MLPGGFYGNRNGVSRGGAEGAENCGEGFFGQGDEAARRSGRFDLEHVLIGDDALRSSMRNHSRTQGAEASDDQELPKRPMEDIIARKPALARECVQFSADLSRQVDRDRRHQPFSLRVRSEASDADRSTHSTAKESGPAREP